MELLSNDNHSVRYILGTLNQRCITDMISLCNSLVFSSKVRNSHEECLPH